MIVLQGTGVSPGIAIGKIHYFHRNVDEVEKVTITDIEQEKERFERCRFQAAKQLGHLAVTMASKIGKENSLLFEIHQMMLEDLDYRDAVIEHIENDKVCAEYAVSQTAREFSEMFAAMDDDYMRERAADVHDVSSRVIELLTGKANRVEDIGEQAIYASVDFAPSETAQFDRDNVLGLATSGGSGNSHTAIFARTMGIPAVIGLKEQLDPEFSGKQIILDGTDGKVIIEPDEKTFREMLAKKEAINKEKQALEAYRGKKTLTKAGKEIKLFANIGSVSDAKIAKENDAEGVGLFRSEFLFLESNDYPSEKTQFEAYRDVAKTMSPGLVIVRTLDIGADKQASYFKLPEEENPALGYRAIRICLTRPEVFKTQLRAIYRASAFGNVAIMLPMIISVDEVLKAKAIIKEVQDELTKEGIAFRADVPIGIMIETPAAAIISDLLAEHVDFFSLGTNDLVQYTLAIDRQNASLDEFCDTHHEAVLRLMEMVAKNAHAKGIWVGVCGELGADLTLTEFFVKIGMDEYSVSPSAVLPLRKRLSELG